MQTVEAKAQAQPSDRQFTHKWDGSQTEDVSGIAVSVGASRWVVAGLLVAATLHRRIGRVFSSQNSTDGVS